MPFCAKCGTNVAEGMSFCPSCGQPIQAAPAGGAPSADTPTRVTQPSPGAAGPVTTAAPMTSNVAGLLTYILGFITGIIFLNIEPYKYDKFVRFHAYQSIFLSGAWVAFWILFDIVTAILAHISFGIFGFIMGLIGLLITLAAFALWLFLMFKAYNNERFMLPFIGELALKQAGQ